MKTYIIYSDGHDYTEGLVIETVFLVPNNFDKKAEEELIDKFYDFNNEKVRKGHASFSWAEFLEKHMHYQKVEFMESYI